MDIHNISNSIINFISIPSIFIIGCIYISLLFITVFRIGSFFSSYFLFLSFVYYIFLVFKNPGKSLDFTNGSIRGICHLCNNIEGYRTVHCNFCKSCYNKQYYHLVFIGKCIAEGNIKYFYWCNLFFTISLLNILRLYNSYIEILYFVLFFEISHLTVLTYIIAKDKTFNEIIKSGDLALNKRCVCRISRFFTEDRLSTLFPLITPKIKIEY